ncbi:MAG TPA: TetR family transcriptional regulator [Stackebrandtia sp.]|jgi:AcrR family transcriptional regulator|uniref:TetR/AcrR family transcriptional regulator n=1 Tax=Stackebrandtia sp. TaxID=2023065 RepID=UPI002D340F55|nr:TetR family transcriptional regulator [Stackebrandtia sp.]HZE41277.1 TetR family transcriptional regulator [Stackebrandtia sp.]
MEERKGLREHKKDQTRKRLSDIALDMFEERGFDNVSVAEIAEAAEVSKKTVFNYFPTKEDIVVGRGAHMLSEPARLVRERPVGTTPLQVVHEHMIDLIKRHHPMTGLTNHPIMKRVRKLITENPSLALRSMRHREHAKHLLAEALVDEGAEEFTARFLANTIMEATHTVFVENFRQMFCEGVTFDVDAMEKRSLAKVHQAFSWLEDGMGHLMRRQEPASASSGSKVACG